MSWWNRSRQRSISVSDPVLAAYFGAGTPNLSGVTVSETSALGLSAVWRAVSLISGTIAGLPLRTLRDVDGTRTRVTSLFDDPAGPDAEMTKFEWLETVVAHLCLHGNAFLVHQYGGAGQLIGLIPVSPGCVSIEQRRDLDEPKTYVVYLQNGQTVRLTSQDLTHVPGLSFDGIRGLSPISVARNSLGTSIAADRSAASMFSNGAMISGLVTTEDTITEAEALNLKATIDAKFSGHENAGSVAFVNKNLKWTPWTMSLEDAQFLQSRQFQIQEISRWFSVPPSLLSDPGAVSTWGTGVEIMNRSLARYGLTPYTSRIEARLSALLPAPRFVEFDYSALLKPAPEIEIPLLLSQVEAGVITVNEMRRIRNMDPIDGGDVLRVPGDVLTTQPADLEQVPA